MKSEMVTNFNIERLYTMNLIHSVPALEKTKLTFEGSQAAFSTLVTKQKNLIQCKYLPTYIYLKILC